MFVTYVVKVGRSLHLVLPQRYEPSVMNSKILVTRYSVKFVNSTNFGNKT